MRDQVKKAHRLSVLCNQNMADARIYEARAILEPHTLRSWK